MRYVAYFQCENCGHKWETYYNRHRPVELGDVCENCLQRPPYRENYKGCVAEPYLYKKLETE